MENILALDLGTQTGWALLTQGHNIFSGSESFHTSRFSGGGMRFLRFRHFLDSLKQKVEIKAVYFEEVRRHLGVDAAHNYGGFLAHLTAWCDKSHSGDLREHGKAKSVPHSRRTPRWGDSATRDRSHRPEGK